MLGDLYNPLPLQANWFEAALIVTDPPCVRFPPSVVTILAS